MLYGSPIYHLNPLPIITINLYFKTVTLYLTLVLNTWDLLHSFDAVFKCSL